jgi:hypothetical protein
MIRIIVLRIAFSDISKGVQKRIQIIIIIIIIIDFSFSKVLRKVLKALIV